jgi:site-specific DNA recombinase
MKNAVCYYRVSRNIQSDLRQERDVKAECKKQGYKIIETFREKISGTIRNRPQMTACLDYINKNDIHYLICSELSRLGRTNEVVHIIDELTEKQICVLTLKENIKTLKEDFSKDTDQILLTNILAGINMKESDSISYRIKSGLNEKVISENVWSGGKYLPFGYDSIKGIMTINPQEAEIVKTIFQKYSEGWGSVKISNWLNLNNIPTKLNYKWQRSTINQMLGHSIYIGKRLWQGEQLETPALRILDTEIFETCGKRLKQGKNTGYKFNKLYDYLFDGGLIKCSVCDKNYFGIHRDKIYKCISGKYHAGCGNRSIKIDWIELEIQRYLATNWFKLIQDNTELNTQTELLEIDLKLLQQELTQQQEQQTRLTQSFIKGRIGEIQYDKQYNKIDILLNNVMVNITETKEKIKTNQITQLTLVTGKLTLQDGEYKYSNLSIDKNTLHTIIKSITVYKDSIKVLLINDNQFVI